MGAALTLGDRLHSRTRAYQTRVSGALRLIERAATLGRVGVSFSAGKDSTVTLDITRRVIPDAPAAFFDSGAEYQSVYDLVERYGVETITPQRSLLDMCRYGGYWGYDGPALVDPSAEFDFWAFLVGEPSSRFVAEHGLSVIALGLRGEESSGRRVSAQVHGPLYRLKSGVWHLCPLATWTADDVWGYIAERALPYNPVYDRMAEVGMPRSEWRISALLGMCGARTHGRYSWLRRIDPALYARLAAEFPKIGNYT